MIEPGDDTAKPIGSDGTDEAEAEEEDEDPEGTLQYGTDDVTSKRVPDREGCERQRDEEVEDDDDDVAGFHAGI